MDDILKQSLELLRYHYWPEWGDRSVMDVFNRLLAKNIKAPGWKRTDHTTFTTRQIRSHREQRSTEELAKFPRTHDRDEPLVEDCPIIVAVLNDEERLLDGTTRINFWLKEGNAELHDVNVHVIEN